MSAQRDLIEKMLSAIIYCHHHGVVHRDIKLDNFIYEHEVCLPERSTRTHIHGSSTRVLPSPYECFAVSLSSCAHAHVYVWWLQGEDAELKLIDFGFACEIKPGKEAMWDQLGTPSYMAPELWMAEEGEYDSSVDMWALGVVTYMLLSGKRPFHHQNKREKARRIRQDPLRFPSPEWDRVSQEAKASARR